MKLKWIDFLCILLSFSFLFLIPCVATDNSSETVTISFYYPVFDENGRMISTEHITGEVSNTLTVSQAAEILFSNFSEIVGCMQFKYWISLGENVSNDLVKAGASYYANYIKIIQVGNQNLPADMLRVQLQIKNKSEEEFRDVRFVTSVNSLTDYQCAGFEIMFGSESFKITTKNAYTSLSGDERTPAEAFVAESNYFIALTVTNFPTNLPFSIRAFVQLQDGTYVYGDWNKSTAGIQ